MQIETVRLGVLRASPAAGRPVRSAQVERQRGRHLLRDGVLHGEDVGEVVVEGLGPELLALASAQKLDGDAEPLIDLLDAPLEDRVDPECLAHFKWIADGSRVLQHRAGRAHLQLLQPSQSGDDSVRHSQTQIGLCLIAA